MSDFTRSVRDYAQWVDTVAFLEGRQEDWFQRNLDPGVYRNFDLDLVLLADRDLRLVGQGAAETGTGALPPSLASLAQAALEDPESQATLRGGNARSTVWFHDDAPYLVGRAAVLDPYGVPGQPARGLLIWIRRLDQAWLTRLAATTQVPFSLAPATSASPREPEIVLREDRVLATLPLAAAGERPWAVAVVSLPRPLAEQRATTEWLLAALVATLVAFTALVGASALDLLLVRRILRLAEAMRRLRRGPELTAGDEIEHLGNGLYQLSHELDAATRRSREQAERDVLTGLGNRARLLRDLPRELVRPGPADRLLGLLLVDLDGFKAVNDSLGHHAGDALLREVALRLADCALSPAHVYRLGGDEFAVLAPELDSEHEALALGQRIVMGVQMLRIVDGQPVAVGASVGLATSPYQDPLPASELLIRADLALYDAKRKDRGRVCAYSASARDRFRDRMEMEALLRRALKEGRITCALQPIVRSADAGIHGFEALARWHEEGRGWIEPSRFIAAAERTQQVKDVDLAVIGNALAAWVRLRERLPEARLNVNVSAQSLLDEGFVPALGELLAQYAVEPGSVAAELTESELGIPDERVEDGIERLRALGVALVIDDFGVGASSLARLARLRAAGVKIDGSFVRDLDGNGGRICRVVVELARELRMGTTAEFVETPEQAARLRAMGCQLQQGYLFGAPMEPNRIEAWIDARQPPRFNGILHPRPDAGR